LNSRSDIKVASDPESNRARALKLKPQVADVFGLDLGLGEGFEGDEEKLPMCCRV